MKNYKKSLKEYKFNALEKSDEVILNKLKSQRMALSALFHEIERVRYAEVRDNYLLSSLVKTEKHLAAIFEADRKKYEYIGNQNIINENFTDPKFEKGYKIQKLEDKEAFNFWNQEGGNN